MAAAGFLEVGEKFNRLIVVARVHGQRYLCVCDCGNEVIHWRANLGTFGAESNRRQSCGCIQAERARAAALAMFTKHGHAKGHGSTPEYCAFRKAIQRCENPKNLKYPRYGGRGIRMCDEWRHNFAAFLSHIGPRPGRGYSLDRIDNDGNYEPGNVRWATALQQTHNRGSRREHARRVE